jgi:hypothetical protein
MIKPSGIESSSKNPTDMDKLEPQPPGPAAPKEINFSSLQAKHDGKITENENVTQLYHWFVNCSCGWHASCFTKQAAESALSVHLENTLIRKWG